LGSSKKATAVSANLGPTPGIVCNRFGSNPALTNCQFSGNQAGFGGGIYNYFSNPTVVNCNFTGNIGSTGGGMYNYFSIPVLSNCTFADNSGDSGGGMYNDWFSDTVLTNCILWGDAPEEVIALNFSTPVVTYSDVQGSWAGASNIDSDPCFVGSGYWDDNGTTGDSNDDSWVAGDYRLRPDSPCVDVGDNNSITADAADIDGDANTVEALPWDLDGHYRISDGDCNGNSRVDMGVYEYGLFGDVDCSGDIDLKDFAVFALAWASEPGEFNWNWQCDLGLPLDEYIDWRDLNALCGNWLAGK
jgi:hypothetical protein